MCKGHYGTCSLSEVLMKESLRYLKRVLTEVGRASLIETEIPLGELSSSRCRKLWSIEVRVVHSQLSNANQR